MKTSHVFVRSVMGGICIAMGGAVYLMVENPVAGALLFTVGLFAIMTNGFYLFTGKVGYLLEQPSSYLLQLAVIWLGNLAGAGMAGYALRLTRQRQIAESALKLCGAKLTDNLLSVFILAVFCNILMYIAVDGFQVNQHEIGKYAGLFLGVAVFVLCGFEHCVANMFYFSAADTWTGRAVLCLLTATAGNAAGGLLIPFSQKLVRLKEKKERA